jgi:hypothetical protein
MDLVVEMCYGNDEDVVVGAEEHLVFKLQHWLESALGADADEDDDGNRGSGSGSGVAAEEYGSDVELHRAALTDEEFPEFMAQAEIDGHVMSKAAEAAADDARYLGGDAAAAAAAMEAFVHEAAGDRGIDPVAFTRLVREVGQDMKTDLVFDDRALHLLLDASNGFLEGMFGHISASVGVSEGTVVRGQHVVDATPQLLTLGLGPGKMDWGSRKRVSAPPRARHGEKWAQRKLRAGADRVALNMDDEGPVDVL